MNCTCMHPSIILVFFNRCFINQKTNTTIIYHCKCKPISPLQATHYVLCIVAFCMSYEICTRMSWGCNGMKRFPHYWPFVRGIRINQLKVDSSRKWPVMFSFSISMENDQYLTTGNLIECKSSVLFPPISFATVWIGKVALSLMVFQAS